MKNCQGREMKPQKLDFHGLNERFLYYYNTCYSLKNLEIKLNS